MKLYVDFDGVIGNTIEAITTLYDLDFHDAPNYKKVDWSDVETWRFEELSAATEKQLDDYFNDDRFFVYLRPMENVVEILEYLSRYHEIEVVTVGYPKNVFLKGFWLKKHLPFIKRCRGVILRDDEDKSCVDMSDGILIDDVAKNLAASNARLKICYGDKYVWNEDLPDDAVRCVNWTEVLDTIEEAEWINGI